MFHKLISPHNKLSGRFKRGLTLVEIMIAMSIITVGVLGFIGSFGTISKVIRVSKAKTIATNLVQEKIESLKNYSYYRLLVTTHTTTASEVGLGSFEYDSGYYPAEPLTIGQIKFERRVLVQKVTESAGGSLVSNNWYENDTGLKLITSHVIWQDGDAWKKVTIRNLRDNPDRQAIDAAFEGEVASGVTPLQDAAVTVLQNVQLNGTSDSVGAYDIDVPAGSYDLKATKLGYFPETQSVSASSGAATTVNFDLVEMGSGTVTATAFLNDNLVISEICAAVNGNDLVEYVEIYNPTESAYVIDQGGSNPAYMLKYIRTSDGAETSLSIPGQTVFLNTTIPANGYYTLASSRTVNGVKVDAFYSDAFLLGAVPANRIPINESGGVAVISRAGLYEVVGTTVDAVGWGLAGSPYGPSKAREGPGMRLQNGSAGLQSDEIVQRIAFASSTVIQMLISPLIGDHALEGNAYDENHNGSDFVHIYLDTDNDFPQNTGDSEVPKSGTPADGAYVYMSDGLSASTRTLGSPTSGFFNATNIATGTWTMLISSGSYIFSSTSIVVTDGATNGLGNVLISSEATVGFVTGRVVDSGNNPLTGINLSASGNSDTTNSLGYYSFQLDVDTYNVVANPNNIDSDYTTAEATGVVVTQGQLSTVDDITIYSGGSLEGFVTTNGTDPLPGIPIVATSAAAGAEVGSYVTDSLGEFDFSNLAIGTYYLTPQLEVGESATPSSLTAAVTAGSIVFAGTFTITNAFGAIEGTVTDGSLPIDTGVLLVAVPSPTTVGANPPTINSTLRDSSTYYYFGSSNSDGEYSISVRGGVTYNVYGWYTTFSGTIPSTIKQSGSASVSAGGTSAVNLSW